MVVYKPKNKTSSSNVEQTSPIINNCECNHNDHHEPEHHNYEHHHHDHCPCPPKPCPQEAVITVEVDGSPEITTDVVYGPSGKDGTINGYNEVEIIGGKNIDVVTKGDCGCHKNKIIINSKTYVDEIDAEPNSDNNECNCENDCDCGCGCCIEQAKPKSCWVIKHNLNKYPSVTVVDRCDREIICEVKYISPNEIHLHFNGKFRGKAFLN